ncbi:MAG: PAS domain-containing protein [Alphaproteobacteria bacterium]
MDAMVIADTAGTICFWNSGAESLFGHTAAQAIGQTLDLIVPPQYREAHWNGFRRAMASGQAAAEGQSGPFPVARADGADAPVHGRLTLLRGPHGQVTAAAVLFASLP